MRSLSICLSCIYLSVPPILFSFSCFANVSSRLTQIFLAKSGTPAYTVPDSVAVYIYLQENVRNFAQFCAVLEFLKYNEASHCRNISIAVRNIHIVCLDEILACQ